MKTEDLIARLVIAMFPVMVVIERLRPARTFPKVPHWHGLGLVLFLYAGA